MNARDVICCLQQWQGVLASLSTCGVGSLVPPFLFPVIPMHSHAITTPQAVACGGGAGCWSSPHPPLPLCLPFPSPTLPLVSPPHRRSTHQPPHEQLLMRLGVGGTMFLCCHCRCVVPVLFLHSSGLSPSHPLAVGLQQW